MTDSTTNKEDPQQPENGAFEEGEETPETEAGEQAQEIGRASCRERV